ncbi:MAG TPA: hypothetical protein VNK04_07245 [Gemmataceae bacterium]|nr:hypothetical protein [Gemmataceae bacterium]
MPDLILTEEQTKVVTQALGPVTVRDASGNVLGRMEPKYTPEMIAELKRRAASPGPWYTGEQVQARLRALQEEWDRTGGFDKAYMLEFLKRLNEADPGHMRPKEQAG